MTEDTRTDDQRRFQHASYRFIKRIGIIPRMTRDERVQFVLNYLNGQVFTDRDVPSAKLLPMVFMPIGFGMFDDWEESDIEKVGCIWQFLSEAGSRGINGCPMFFSAHLMHCEDFERCAAAITKELERRSAAAEGIDV